jgi:hypothetical protein
MLTTVEGKYSHGTITLFEMPEGIEEGHVLVTFLAERRVPTGHKPMVFGQFSGDILPTEEDFKIAEWHGGEKTGALDGG